VGREPEFDAFEGYGRAYAAYAETTPGFQVVPVGRPGSLVCGVSRFAQSNFNRVMNVRLADAEVDAAIDRVKSVHRAAGVVGSWWLEPGTTPAGIEHALERHGYKEVRTAPAMARELTELPPIDLAPGVELTFVRDRRTMREAQRVVGIGFGRDMDLVEEMAAVISPLGDETDSPHRVVVARLDGIVVASAAGVTTGDVCGVLNVVTLPEARGRGIGRATTLAVMHDARERGARHAVLHASKMGFGVYLQMGFHHPGDFRLFTDG
jgi:ribosomal protein S18 acetylase RimI-like enzyme